MMDEFNLQTLSEILAKWVAFAEGECGDMPELGEVLDKTVEWKEGFEKQLLETDWREKAIDYFQNSYGSRKETIRWFIREILGVPAGADNQVSLQKKKE